MARPLAERWRSGMVLLLSAGLFVGVVAFAPGSNPAALRRLLGLEDPLGTPAQVPAGGSYAFLQHQPGRPAEPATWDPCRAIEYEVNPVGGPDDAVDLVAEGVAQVSSVSGLQFDYVGTTDRRPVWEERFVPGFGTREPVLFSWADADEVPLLAGDVAGVGGPVSVERDGRVRYVSGGVTLDVDNTPSERLDERAILLHEIGHLVGLDHVSSPRELMNAENVGLTEFGRGDLNGLVALGSGPCG